MAAFSPVGVELVVKGSKDFFGTLDKAGGRVAGFGKKAAKMALIGTAAVTGFGVAVAGASIKVAAAWESAFAGVVKTLDTTQEELDQTEQGLRDMAKVVPIDVEQLAAIAELGGQLGIVDKNTEDASAAILDFTETVAAMGVATNLTTEEAAVGFAQIANIMGTSTDQISNMGSSIVALGNNFATTERDILSFAQRIAGAGQIAGLTEAQVFGIGAAFSSVGIQAEAGGTAVQKVLLAMNAAALQGGEELEIFAATAGMSADDFATSWEEDAGAAFNDFVLGLGIAGDDAITVLSALGMTDQRLTRAFLSLAGAGDLLTEAMDLSTDAFAANTALAKEAAQRYATTESQFKLLKNTIKDVGITVGSVLLPVVNKAIGFGIRLAVVFGERIGSALNTLKAAIEPVWRVFSNFIKQLIQGGESVNYWFRRLPAALEPVARVMIVLVGAIRQVADAFGYLISRIQGWGIGEIFTTFEDGSSILEGFFERLGLGEEASRAVANAINKIVSIFNTFKNAIIGTFQLIKHALVWDEVLDFREFEALTKLTKPVRDVIYKIVDIFLVLVDTFKKHKTAIIAAVTAIGKALAFAFAKAAIIKGIMTVGKLILGLTNPITLILGAIGLFAAAWAENWFGIREIVAKVIGKVRPIIEKLGKQLETVISKVVKAVGQFIERLGGIEKVIGTVVDVIGSWLKMQGAILGGIIELGSTIFISLLPALANIAEFIFATVLPALSRLFDWIAAQIPAAVQWLSDLWINTLMPALATVWEFISSSVIPILEQIVIWLADNIPVAIQTLSEFFTGVLVPAIESILPVIQSVIAWVVENWPAFRDTIVGIAEGVIAWIQENWPQIQSTIEGVITTVRDIVTTIVGEIATFWIDNFSTIVTWVEENWPLIQETIETVIGAIQTIIETVIGAIVTFWEENHNTIETIVATIWEAIKTLVDTTIQAILLIIQTTMNLITTSWDTKWNVIKTAAETIWNGIKTAIGTILGSIVLLIQTKMNDALNKVKEVAGDFIEAGKKIVQNIRKGIEDAWGELIGWFKGKLDGLTSLLPFSEPKNPASPLRGLSRAGEAIVDNILMGMDQAVKNLEQAQMGLAGTFQAAGTGQVAMAAASSPMMAGPTSNQFNFNTTVTGNMGQSTFETGLQRVIERTVAQRVT